MSVRLGSNIIAGRSPQPSLFDFKWADHIISDPQWVRADTNSWQYKVAYDAAYNHLEADIEGKEAQSETIEGIIITYYLANDGHKVCLPDQSEYLDALYNTTGIAWYYIVDTINKRFKVPRTKWGFTGLRSQTAVGNYIAEGLPNITGHLLFDYGSYSTGPYNVTGAFKSNVNKSGRPNTYDSNTASGDVLFDASLSNSIYGNSLTVQPRATQMYLYFFVGSFTQDALVNAAAFSVESIAEVLDEQTTTITETWDTASETIAADMATIAEDMEQLDTMINAQYHPNIFEFKWSDAILNDIQWLRSDTFSWQSGNVYETAYQHLLDDIAGKTLQTETIEGTTISYYLADDMHKICPADQESNIVAIYEATGIAWYYILDTTNERFKLPRTTFGFTGKRDLDTVGKYVVPGLPNITGYMTNGSHSLNVGNGTVSANSALYAPGTKKGATVAGNSGSDWIGDIGFDASRSNSIYGASTTVQAPATEMYLYFYVGKFLQSAIVNTAGIAAEQLNTLTADVTDLNSHKVIAFQAPTSENNYTWYRKYADGWVEQGGRSTGLDRTITLPITMSDANYVIITELVGAVSWAGYSHGVQNITTTGFRCWYDGDQVDPSNWSWQVSGMAA